MLSRTGALALFLVTSAPALAAQQGGGLSQPASALPQPAVRYDTDLLPAAFHRSRRDALARRLPAGSVAVVEGARNGGDSIDDLQSFVQDPDFYYLTGSEEAGSALLLAPAGVRVDGQVVHEVLFVPRRDPAQEIWLGRRFGVERAQRELGVERVVAYDRFEEIVGPLVADAATEVLTNDDPRVRSGLDGLRSVKTEDELRLLRHAIDITADAHRAVLGAMQPGWKEYEVEALIEYTFAREGAERPGFPSIVASGENSVLLHYDTNRRTTEPGDLVVMDIGASYHGYTADVTRTVPVDGTFTSEQRAVYELVLKAQKAAIAQVRSGASFGAPHQAASNVLIKGLVSLGILRDARDFGRLARFYPHATSHYLGLQVHDVGEYGPLEPGQVITVEPGIYITPAKDVDPKWWNIGVRIEDDVLVTSDGPVVLSAGAPKDPSEIEKAMRGTVTR